MNPAANGARAGRGRKIGRRGFANRCGKENIGVGEEEDVVRREDNRTRRGVCGVCERLEAKRKEVMWAVLTSNSITGELRHPFLSFSGRHLPLTSLPTIRFTHTLRHNDGTAALFTVFGFVSSFGCIAGLNLRLLFNSQHDNEQQKILSFTQSHTRAHRHTRHRYLEKKTILRWATTYLRTCVLLEEI